MFDLATGFHFVREFLPGWTLQIVRWISFYFVWNPRPLAYYEFASQEESDMIC